MNDYILRASTDDGALRAFCALTTKTVNRAASIHKTTPVATAALGRLLSAAAMMGTMLKSDDDLITLQVTGSGPLGRVLAVTDNKANVKGYVGNPYVDIPKNEKGKLDVGAAVGKDGFLTVIRDFGLKEPYIGKIKLVTGEIGDDLTSYFATSEQIPSAVGLGVLVDVDLSVKNAGGFIVQVMPEATDDDITALEKNVSKITSITDMLENGLLPEDILKILFDGFSYTIGEKVPTMYNCNCSRQKVEKALISIGEKEIEDILNTDKKAQLTCHFCDNVYDFSEDDLKQILSSIKNK